MLKDLILKNRSYRRFFQDYPITRVEVIELINLARLSPSARNLQPLKYSISVQQETNEKIFSCLAWAGYLKDWAGPEEGERPSAYVVILGDRLISNNFRVDSGIAMEALLLGAVEKGLGGCIIGSINKPELRKILDIPENLEPIYVIALGSPKEEVSLELLEDGGSVEYWRDDEETHHVPKRCIDDIIL